MASSMRLVHGTLAGLVKLEEYARLGVIIDPDQDIEDAAFALSGLPPDYWPAFRRSIERARVILAHRKNNIDAFYGDRLWSLRTKSGQRRLAMIQKMVEHFTRKAALNKYQPSNVRFYIP